VYSIGLFVPRQLEGNSHGGGASVWEFEALQILETVGRVGAMPYAAQRRGSRLTRVPLSVCAEKKSIVL
jgi:hypothetical protein